MKAQLPNLKKFLIKALLYFCIINWFSFCFAQTEQASYEELSQKYVPQSTPEATYRLELEMMSRGMYCYDLPIFDPEWRNKGSQVLYSSSYKSAQRWDTDFKAYIEGDYAVIYYPQDKSLGPVFLYRDASGWVLDRTTVINNIHYGNDNSGWFAYEGDYPYLGMLKKVFYLRKGRLGDDTWAYQIQE